MKRYCVQEAGSLSYVLDGGEPYIVEIEEDVELDIIRKKLIKTFLPKDAVSDPSFIAKIELAETVKEVEDICKSWS